MEALGIVVAVELRAVEYATVIASDVGGIVSAAAGGVDGCAGCASSAWLELAGAGAALFLASAFFFRSFT